MSATTWSFLKQSGQLIRPSLLLTGVLCFAASAMAVSPAAVIEGKMLFEKNWNHRNPVLGNDGLGPLFNAQSCVACHNQGGIGGGGDARFNAKSIGIERMQISGGRVSSDMVAQAVRGFHPGFVDPQGVVVNTFAVSHHGGTPLFTDSRKSLMSNVPAVFSSEGGPTDASEVRQANATPILYTAQSGPYKISVRARMFQRNTTPLFGSGLIDQITGKQLEALERAQKAHPEISGRKATLPDGRYGRFGWRGNVATLLEFCDQACAAEVGLETHRKPQPIDPTNPGYRNPSVDISDTQIKAMTAFMAALPAPHRQLPSDSHARELAFRGEKVFSSVGCAVCHVPNVGPAQGIYSDILLHDMGRESMDLNPADPYITRVTPITNYERSVSTTKQTTRSFDDAVSTTYYGRTSVMSGTMSSTQRSSSPNSRSGNRGRQGRNGSGRIATGGGGVGYDFQYPTQPATTIRFVNLGSQSRNFVESDVQSKSEVKKTRSNQRTASGKKTYKVDTTEETTRYIQETKHQYLRIHIEPTNYMQEWRTPPLWGVRDSAPYMHDGRAETLLEAISMHDGEAAMTRDRFLNLSIDDRNAVIAFLNTLVAPATAPQPAS